MRGHLVQSGNELAAILSVKDKGKLLADIKNWIGFFFEEDSNLAFTDDLQNIKSLLTE